MLDLIAVWLAGRQYKARESEASLLAQAIHKSMYNTLSGMLAVAGEVESPARSTRRMKKSYRVPEK